MTPEERDRLNYLCKGIVIEKDPQTFDSLVKELETLLDAKYARLHLKRDSGSLVATPTPAARATQS